MNLLDINTKSCGTGQRYVADQYWDFLTLARRVRDGTSTHSNSKTPSTVRIVFLVLSLRFIVFFIGSNHAERVQRFSKVNNKYRKFLFYRTSEHLRKSPVNKQTNKNNYLTDLSRDLV